MNTIWTRLAAIILSATLLLLPATTARADSDLEHLWAETAVDITVARPLGIAATAIGSALFVVTLPFAALSGSIDTTGEMLVARPFRYTFARPFGVGLREW